MKVFYVEYIYENFDGRPISGTHRGESEKEAKEFIEQIKNRRQITSMSLVTYEKII